MRTIAVVNQKGGCGKTITAINLAGFLALERRRVLLVDLDPQGHATLGLTRDVDPHAKTISDVLLSRNGGPLTSLRDVTRPVLDCLDIVPADILLSAAPERLAAVQGREDILADALHDVRFQYDYVIVDCPPNVGLLTFNALKACSEAIVPVDPSFFSLHGIGKVMETFDVLERQTGHRIAARVLVTLYSGRTQFAREVVDEIRRHLGGRHYETIIRYSIKLAEAASHGMPIASYGPQSAGFVDYRALAVEVLREEAAQTPTRDGVVFAFEAPEAERVQLVGDFNAWTLEGSDMTRQGRFWRSVITLEPGRYRYRYIVDGVWQSDPANAEVEPAPYGGDNSVLLIGERLADPSTHAFAEQDSH